MYKNIVDYYGKDIENHVIMYRDECGQLKKVEKNMVKRKNDDYIINKAIINIDDLVKKKADQIEKFKQEDAKPKVEYGSAFSKVERLKKKKLWDRITDWIVKTIVSNK